MSTLKNFADFLFDILSYTDNQNEIVEKIHVHNFLGGSIKFDAFVDYVITLCKQKLEGAEDEVVNDNLYYLDQYAKLLQSDNKDNTEITDDVLKEFKTLLKQVISPPKIEKLEEDSIFEVTGNNVVMSEIIKQVESDFAFIGGKINEVRIYAKSTLHVDVNLEQNKWHGINFVVVTDELNIRNENVVWNFSGNDQEKTYSENAGKNINGEGTDGNDGEPGESGGNVLIKANKAHQGIQLKIISNGGKGGTGQDGGDGDHGTDGRNVTQNDIDAIQNSADTNYEDGERHYNEAESSIKTNSKGNVFLQKSGGGRWGDSYIKSELQNGFEITYINTELVKCLTLIKGTKGTAGKRGGLKGLGGEGGFSGHIHIDIPKKTSVQMENFKGSSGVEGHGGYIGRNGVNGCDMGRLGWVVKNDAKAIVLGIFTLGFHSIVQLAKSNITGALFQKYYGEAKNQYLEIYKSSKDDTDSVWCKHLGFLVRVTHEGRRSSDGVKVYQERNNAKEIRERKKYSKAVPKRALNLNEIQKRYKTSFAKLSIDLSFVTAVKSKAQKKTKEKVDIDVKFTKNISSEIKKPLTRKPKILEVDSSETIQIKENFEELDSLIVSKLRYTALETIGKERLTLPDIDINEKSMDHLEEFLQISSNQQSLIKCVSDLNMSLNSRKEYFESLQETTFSNENKKGSIFKEFIKETSVSNKQGVKIFDEFKKYSTEKLSKFLLLAEKVEKSYENDIENRNKLDAELSSLQKSTFKELKTYYNSKNVLDDLSKHISTCMHSCPTFLELVAQKHMVNIRIYTENETSDKFILKESYNTYGTSRIYLTKKLNLFKELNFNTDLIEFQEYRKHAEMKYRNILLRIEEFSSSNELDSYIKERKFDKMLENNEEISPLYGFVVSSDIDFIRSVLEDNVEKNHVETIVQKLETIKKLGASSTIHYMADKLHNAEHPNLTLRDINLVINTVMMLVEQGYDRFTIIDWIIVTRRPENWIIYLTFVRLENHFQKVIEYETYQKLEKYLINISNKNIISLFCLKLKTTEKKDITLNEIENLLFLLSVSDPDINSISNLKVEEWAFAIKEYYWTYKLRQAIKWKNDEPLTPKAVQFLLQIENKYQYRTTNVLVEAFSNGIVLSDIDKEEFTGMLRLFANEIWSITNQTIEILKQSSDVSVWKQLIKGTLPKDDHVRNINDLLKLIEGQLNLNTSSRFIDLQLAQKRIVDIVSLINTDSVKQIEKYSKEVKSWSSKRFLSEALSAKKNKHAIEKLLAMVDHAVFLWSKQQGGKGFNLRDTQKLSTIIILKHDKNTLLQVATGEGKSLIVAALAIIRVLMGQKVDVITTSPVLAERDVEELKNLYDMFGISVSHNTTVQSEKRQAAYKRDVVYGDLSNFQRDYLLDQFYKKGIRGDRGFPSVIIDEVDSMLLDKGNSTLYLSHEIPELDKLEWIYLHIWTRLIMSKTKADVNKRAWDTEPITSEIKKSLYGFVDEDDIKQLQIDILPETIAKILETLRIESIIDEDGFLINDEKFNKPKLEELLNKHEHTKKLIGPMLCLLQQKIERERFITSPKYLKSFILQNLSRWIDNAKLALYLQDRDDYVVDIDRNDEDNLNTVITILDKDTGIDQINSQWDSGLHQFLQLKHGCRLTPQSLKAVFISNVSYFKKYDQLNGLSGTLGSEVEREHLVQAHNVDFLTIPTFKQKNFVEEPTIVTSTVNEWSSAIFEECMNKISQNRSVLIICESVSSVEEIYKIFFNLKGEKRFKLSKYTRDYEKLDMIHNNTKLTPGNIIIATNLAGRGTDLKLDDVVIDNAGLHVILTYLAMNDRIEQQAMGRAARKGEPGSGQLVILSDEFTSYPSNYRILKIKSQRRLSEAEHVSAVRKHYENQIKHEEMCFLKFTFAWEENRQRFSANPHTNGKVQELLERGVLDKWAFWLDRNMGHYQNFDATTINQKIDNFVKSITTFGLDSSSYGSWVDPLSQSVQLGKLLAKNKETAQDAIKIFDKVSKIEPEFCEAAFYYKALAIFNLHARNGPNIHQTLLKAKEMFNKRKGLSQRAKGLIANLKEYTASANSQSVAFEDQQERIMMIQDTFIKSIHDIIGHVADENILKAADLSDFQIKYVMPKLRQNNLMFKDIELNSIENSSLKPYCKSNKVDFQKLKKFTSLNAGKVTNINSLTEKLKTSDVFIPHREEFWKILEEAKILTNVKSYYHLHRSEINIVDPSFIDKALKEKQRAQLPPDCIYLYPEFLDKSSKYLTFEKSVFFNNKLLPKETIEYLELHHCFTINKCANIDVKKLKHYEFERFGSIKPSDLVTDTLTNETALEVLQEMVKNEILVKKTIDNEFTPTEKYYNFHYNTTKVNMAPIYMDMIEEKLNTCLSYANAARELLNTNKFDKTTTLSLSVQPYKSLVTEMMSHGIICSPQLNSVPGIKENLRKIFDGFLEDEQLKNLPSARQNFVSIIATLETNNVLKKQYQSNYLVKRIMDDSFQMKTVQLLVNTIYTLRTEKCIDKLSNIIEEKLGTLQKFGDDFELVTHPLSEFTKLETKNEENQCMINGHDEILIGQKKKQEPDFWTILTSIIISVVMIVVGIVLAYYGQATLAEQLIGAGISLLLPSVMVLLNIIDISKYNDIIQQTVSNLVTRFLADLKKIIELLVPQMLTQVKTEEQISQVVGVDVKKINYAKQISQYEGILNEAIASLTEKVKSITGQKINEAINRTGIRNTLRNLFENKSFDEVSTKLNTIEDFVLSKDYFNRKMTSTVIDFKNKMVEQIVKMADNLKTNDVEILSKFKKAIQACIDDGIINFYKTDADAFKENLMKNVFSYYEHRLNITKKNLSDLKDDDINKKSKKIQNDTIDAKQKALIETVVHNTNSLIDKGSAEMHIELKHSLLTRINFLTNRQLQKMNPKRTIVAKEEVDLNETQTNENTKDSLVENEYKMIHLKLMSLGKLNQTVTETPLLKLQKTDFEVCKKSVINNLTIAHYKSILRRNEYMMDIPGLTFASQLESNQLINDVLQKVAFLPNSTEQKNFESHFDQLTQTLAEHEDNEYSIIVNKLFQMYQKKPIKFCLNELYKFSVLSIVEHNHETWLKTLHSIEASNFDFESKIGSVKLNETVIIAATNNIKQPLVWNTFNILTSGNFTRDGTIIRFEKKMEERSPMVQQQLMKYILENYNEEILPQKITFTISGSEAYELDYQEIAQNSHGNGNFLLQRGTYITKEAIELLYKYKDYLPQLRCITMYCEANRSLFYKPPAKILQNTEDADDFL